MTCMSVPSVPHGSLWRSGEPFRRATMPGAESSREEDISNRVGAYGLSFPLASDTIMIPNRIQ